MSEIAMMYRNAHIYPRVYGDITKETFENKVFNMVDMCNEAFTAEKQLKILCFIVNKKHSVTFHDQVFGGDKLTLEKIQENLAWAINRVWKDLTEKEKEQIRTILNG
jgi:hypothetical protein